MKTERLVLCALAVGAAVVWWLSFPATSDSPKPILHAHHKQTTATTASAGPPRLINEHSQKISREDKALRQLVVKTKADLIELQRLCSLPDEIGNFRKRADLENDFTARLDPKTAERLVKAMPPGFIDSYFGGIALRKWASGDRPGAAEWMKAHPSDSSATAQALAQGWLAEDREGLQAYLAELPPGYWKYNILKTASEDALVAKTPRDTISFLDGIQGQDARRDQIYEWAATAWAIQDPAAAAQWAGLAGDYAQRQKLLAAVAIGRANNDPASAASWALSKINDQCALLPVITAISRVWAGKDPQSAANWVSRFPPGPARESALGELLTVWNSNSAEEAMAWQQSLSDPAFRTEAGRVLATIRAQRIDER